MKQFILVLMTVLFFIPCIAQTSPATKAANNGASKEQQLVQALLGAWVIDLRPAPDADPFLKDFTLKAYEADALKGTFYDTPFENGRIHTAWGKLFFAFTTADNSGTYFHSGYLENGTLSGISFSPSRQFVMPWTGVRKNSN
jgi:hypothetical protein